VLDLNELYTNVNSVNLVTVVYTFSSDTHNTDPCSMNSPSEVFRIV
jgi:hypothetical protein